jgi:Ran GTPase-activating protein (RanGAP) involved in mRNA processing and transport
MGAKKGKKGKGQEDEDNPTENFLPAYKKACRENEVTPAKSLVNKVEEIMDEGEDLNEILVNDRIGEFGARALALALKRSTKGEKGMPILKSLRIWEGELGDEGVRNIVKFIIETNNSSLKLIEFLNCNIGPLGCEFISRIFEPSLPCSMEILTLDYNNFGNEGLSNLLTYLPLNSTLTYLSLAYCGIDEKGIQYFGDLITKSPSLEKLILMGNPIKDEGVLNLCSFLQVNTNIEEVNINNVGFGISEDTINKLIYLVENNKNIVMYQCKFNFITLKNFELIVKTLKDPKNKHIYQFNVDEKYPKELFDMYFKALKGRKYKKKKKGKGKKGKKKK